MIRKAGPEDAAALEAFLAQHAASSMFLRGNLAAHGTQEATHAHGTTFWMSQDAGAITGVVGCTNKGNLMCQAPAAPLSFWQAACQQLKGREIAAITGDPVQTGAWIDALGLAQTDFALNQLTPLFEIATADVAPVRDDLVLRAPEPADAETIEDWLAGFHRDTKLVLPKGASLAEMAKGFVASADARILSADGVAVAMTTLNARVHDTVQVGGVYVPPEHRTKGYGGAVVAGHLAELAGQGITRAVLFAANPAAARAYTRVGFRRVGDYRVAMLSVPQVVRTDARA